MAENSINLDWLKNKETLLAVGIIAVVGMLVIPLPTFMLDFLLAVSIMISMLVLMITMFVPKSYDFSIFPALLLVTTVFRLALNVSSTRLILMQGSAFDGKIIKTFGQFVVGGNYIIGFLIFIILVAVQFIVITKGATRTAEVAARFALDALPGKQMTIDADFQSGTITEEEKNRRQAELRRETDFYGQMDGASKFVQGDVKVGILITIVNLIAGFIIGIAVRGESFEVALKTYSLLSIGDGLVSQIPSLLTSTASGIIVTRAVSKNTLPEEFAKQLTAQPRALMISGGALLVSAIIPGFPKISLILLGGSLIGMGYVLLQREEQKAETAKTAEKKSAAKDSKPESVMPYINVDALEVEIGYSLITLADPSKGGTLLDRITNIRRMSAINMGLIVPPIRIRDNMDLSQNEYSILIKGVEVGSGKLEVDRLMAMDAGEVIEKIEGTEFVEPSFGLKAIWIDAALRERAERNGYIVVDCSTIVSTHLTEIIKRHAAELLGRQEVQQLIDSIKSEYPAIVDDLVGKKLSVGVIQKVLQGLLREKVSIRNVVTIFETLSNYSDYTHDPFRLIEYVRVALARQICKEFATPDKRMNVITVDPDIESIVMSSIREDEIEGRVVGLDPDTYQSVMTALIEAYNTAKTSGFAPVFIVSPNIRSVLFNLIEREVPDATVLSYNEIAPNISLNAFTSAMINAA